MIEMSASHAMEAIRSLDLLTVHSPLTDLAMGLRTLPERLGRTAPMAAASMRLGDLFDNPPPADAPTDWVGLAEERGRQLVFGAVGTFWRPKIVWKAVSPEKFAEFGEPGWGKIAASLVSHPYGLNRSVLTYEARTVLNDELSRRRFSHYWTLVSPFVGVIMRAALSTVANDSSTSHR